MNEPKWIALHHNINGNRIEQFNILSHGGVRKDIVKATKKCKTKELFAEELRSSLMRYYWSKSEWEIIIGPWCGGRDTKEIKIDVFDQIMYNWEIFLDYIWNERKQICKWDAELTRKYEAMREDAAIKTKAMKACMRMQDPLDFEKVVTEETNDD